MVAPGTSGHCKGNETRGLRLDRRHVELAAVKLKDIVLDPAYGALGHGDGAIVVCLQRDNSCINMVLLRKRYTKLRCADATAWHGLCVLAPHTSSRPLHDNGSGSGPRRCSDRPSSRPTTVFAPL